MFNDNPLVTIIMCTYNGEHYVKEQIESILNQTYHNFILEIYDDASTDNTERIIKSFVESDARIKYYRNPFNLGYLKNFEQAIAQTQTQYIALSDQDDIWVSHKIEMELNALREVEEVHKDKPILVHSDLTIVDSELNVIHKSYFKYRDIDLSERKALNRIVSHNGIMGCTLLFNHYLKDLILPFPESLNVHDYWIALVNECFGIRITLKEKLVYYRIHQYNSSNSSDKVKRKYSFFQKIINSDPLPFHHIDREEVLSFFLTQYKLEEQDKKILEVFIDYLRLTGHPVGIFFNLLKYNILRSNIRYRLKILFKLIWFSKYRIYDIKRVSTSKMLIKNVKCFIHINKGKKGDLFYGWGRKKSGQQAVLLAKKYHASFILLEDGFIRSLGLGVNGSPSFSLIEDDIGIYYDATVSSKLENILTSYNFNHDKKLMTITQKAIRLIRQYKISKYNDASLNLPNYLQTEVKKVLIIAQTAGDASLKYGLASDDPQMMVRDAVTHNPEVEVYLKVHPDVLAGKKKSNVDIAFAKKYCKVITENINPIVLLEAFDTVYTQTSQMGFEALLLGKKVKLYGMPFYAGWSLPGTELNVKGEEIEKVLKRRKRKLSLEEVFAGAYILYTRYFNPYQKRESDIIDTIEEIKRQRKNSIA